MALGVTVDFNANIARFEGQVERLSNNLSRFETHAQGVSSTISKSFAALGVGLSIAGVTAFVKSGIDAADALSKMSDKTGIAVEKLSGWQLAVDLADTNMESLSQSSNKLSIFIAKNGEEMRKLGVSAKDPSDALLQFADVFSKIEDPQRRAALGAAVLGRSYADLAPLLMQGSDALRQQIKDGQEMSGITAEQAKAAADFNDKMSTMGRQFIGMQSKISIGVLTPFANMAEAMETAINRGNVLQGVLEGIANGARKTAFDVGGGLTKELDDLNVRIADAKENLSKSKNGGIFGRNSANEIAAERDVNLLLSERAALLEKISNDRKKPLTPAVNVDESAINSILKLGDATDKASSAAKKSAAAEIGRKAAIAAVIDNLKFDIELTGQSVEQQRLMSEIRAATSKATDSEAAAIRELIVTKYDLIEADAILADGVRLATRQSADMAADYDRLNQKFNGAALDLSRDLSDALDARASGIIRDDQELKKILDGMGKNFNALTDNVNADTDRMSEYAVQAARNMQSAFADFLFDPFKDGAEGMAINFLKAIQRMAADAAAAQIMEGLFGKTGAKDGGGLLGAAASGIGNFMSGFFHDGGIAGNGSRSVSVHPSVFSGAPRYHNGGIAGLKANEVPAILERGELVISNKQLQQNQNDTSMSAPTIINNYFTITGETSRQSQQQIASSAGRGIQQALMRTR